MRDALGSYRSQRAPSPQPTHSAISVLIIELDGYRDHSQPDRFGADRERDALAIELRFDTLRITWKRLKHKPAPLARQFRAILAARDPRAPD